MVHVARDGIFFSKDTHTADDGYPQYRRRAPSDGGFSLEINGVKIDNQWVVPYNPVLSVYLWLTLT